MDTNKKTKAKTQKKKKYDIKNMGINIDKNEYYEIIMSNSNHPEAAYGKRHYD